MERLLSLFREENIAEIRQGVYYLNYTDGVSSISTNQKQTNSAFTDKWATYSESDVDEQIKLFDLQKKWFLKLYNYSNEKDLMNDLLQSRVILDAGTGLGFKAAWLAELAPHAKIIAVDNSESIHIAYEKYAKEYKNIIFVKGDIAKTYLDDSIVDFVVCDQVIMHTENPRVTLKELARVMNNNGKLLCYWYRKKALPRELLDDYFRENVKNFSREELWQLADGVTNLGKLLTELNITFDVPDIPILGIKGGKTDLQRFFYWNFMKCFWNMELGYNTSLATNFDWYAPSNAKRFSKKDVYDDLEAANLIIKSFHEEEACYSGKFEHAHGHKELF